jgi:hypothetical protein
MMSAITYWTLDISLRSYCDVSIVVVAFIFTDEVQPQFIHFQSALDRTPRAAFAREDLHTHRMRMRDRISITSIQL